MTVVELLQELRRLKVSISARNARLVVDAPAGVITPALAQEIKSNKAALLDLIGSIGEEQAAEKTELARAPDEDRLSLTQERIWAIDQLNPDSSQFNLPGGWWLDGALDVDVLARAVSEFAAQHDIFRRRFVSHNGSPRVSPADHPGVDFRIMTLQDIGLESEDRARLTRWFEEISAVPFDLSDDALLRVVLLTVNETRHLLSVISHSIVWDAWCYDIFLSEVGKYYEALLAGETVGTPGLQHPVHQYSDFVHWQRIHQESPASRKSLEKAIAGLEGYGRRVALPHVHPAPDQKDHSGARFNFDIPPDMRERLRAFSRHKGVTPFMVFLSAYAFLLCRYAGKDKVLITIPLRGRERQEFEAIPGPFTNNLFFPVDVQGHTFSSLLAHVKQETGRTFGGEVPSFERLIEAINQDLADSAFFQLQFSYQNVENRGTHWAEGIRISAGPAHDSDNAHAEISFWMREGKESMDGAIDYRTRLFDEAFITTFFARLMALIGSAIATPDARLHDLDCKAPADAQPGPAVPHRTQASTLKELRETFARNTENTVVVTRSSRISAGELLSYIDDSGRVLPGDSADSTKELLQALSELAAARGLIVTAPGGHWSSEACDTAVAAWRDRLPEPCERVLIALPEHSATRVIAWLAVLAAGRRLCLPTNAEAADEVSLARLIKQEAPSLVLVQSPAMEALLDMGGLPAEPLYLVWAMPGASQLQDRISAQGLNVRYLIASEATLGIGLTGSGDDWPLTFEQQENGIALRVLDQADREQLTGLDGRLALSLLESEPAIVQPVITVRRDDQGRIRWPDLDQVDATGLAHVSENLAALDSVRDAYVEVRRANPAAPATIAWIEQELGRQASNSQIRSALRARGVKPPSIIINVDRIMRDRNHRVLRQELDHPDHIPAHSRFEPPVTNQEVAFAGIWRDVLSIDRISINDTFANLGGSSVQALVILSETQKRLGCSFEPRLLFFQSLKDIAARFPDDLLPGAPA